jgi:PKD repeat protein
LIVTFTDASTPGGTLYSWQFGDGQTGTGVTVNHTYAASATPYDVTETVTYPSPTGPLTLKKTALISVSAPLCTVPALTGQKFSKEQTNSGLWANAGFDPSKLTAGPGKTNAGGNGWDIQSQTLTGGNQAPCSSSIQVNDH